MGQPGALELDRNTGIRIGYHHAKEYITGITVDKHEDLYGCLWKQNTIVVWGKDLVKRSEIKLDDLFITENTRICDICYSNKTFYILFENSCFPVQTFNKKGDLIRCVVKESDIKCSQHIAIDHDGNILISDTREDERNIRIFSNIGEPVHSIQVKHSQGKEKEKGKAVGLLDGIGSDPIAGNIYICDSDHIYKY